jgi:3-hydroxybutyryl-CoA dehydrogenase
MTEIKVITVIGAGIIGSGTAQLAAQAGYTARMVDTDDKFIQQGFKAIKESLRRFQKAGKMTAEEAEQVLSRIEGTTDMEEAVKDADLVFECLPEKIELKKDVFRKLDKYCPKHTILASESSAQSITELAGVTGRPEKVLGFGFANPVPIMPLSIINMTMLTAEETKETALAVVKKLGKNPVVCPDGKYVPTRLLQVMVNEAFYLLWEGAVSKEDIDRLARYFGHPMGPLELADFGGLDTCLSVLQTLHRELGERYRPCPLIKKYVEAGHLGRKTGRGVYDYSSSPPR